MLPSIESGGIVVFITGDQTQGGAAAKFQEMFTLFPTAAGSLYIRNDIFRTGPGTAPVVNAAGGDLAESFVRQYFEIYDKDRKGLAAIYVRVVVCRSCSTFFLFLTPRVRVPLPFPA